jgi:amidase
MAVAASATSVVQLSPRVTASSDLPFASAIDAARAIRDGEISSLELTRLMFERIERYRSLNAVVTVMQDEALERARAADDARAKRQSWGPLHGVPCTVKDAFDTIGVRTTVGVSALKDYVAATDAVVVERLRRAGAIQLGMTNVPPLLRDYQSANPVFGRTNNPWNLERTPGGSTGGGAAALAAGLGYLSIGSDLAGSIRIPAHFCGVYGHKPSYGVIPERGHIPPLPADRPAPPSGLNVVGPLARTAEDLTLAMEVLGGPDADTAIAYKWSLPPARRKQLAEYRVGYVVDDPFCPVTSEVRSVLASTVDALRKAGTPVREGWPTGIDAMEQWHTYYFLLLSAMAAGEVPDEALPDIRKQAESSNDWRDAALVSAVTSPHKVFLQMQRRQLQARAAWQEYFREYDVFLMPVAFIAAFPHEDRPPSRLRTADGERPYSDLEAWMALPTLSGLPVTVAPVGRNSSGLPVGIQIVGPYLEDATSIDFAARMADVVGGFVAPQGY